MSEGQPAQSNSNSNGNASGLVDPDLDVDAEGEEEEEQEEEEGDSQTVNRQTSNPSTSKSQAKSKPSPFIVKLFQMLEQPLNNEVSALIKWSEDGSFFSVVEPADFARKILPQYFKHNNWNSFIRQLNIYSFQKLNSRSYDNTAQDSQPEWEFSHPHFLKGKERGLKNIVRRAGGNSKSGQEAHQEKVVEISNNAKNLAEISRPGNAGGSKSGSEKEKGKGKGTVDEGQQGLEIASTSNLNSASSVGNRNRNQSSSMVMNETFMKSFEALQRQVSLNQNTIERLQSQVQITSLRTASALERLSSVLKEVIVYSKDPSQPENSGAAESRMQKVTEAQGIVNQIQDLYRTNPSNPDQPTNELQSYLPQLMASAVGSTNYPGPPTSQQIEELMSILPSLRDWNPQTGAENGGTSNQMSEATNELEANDPNELLRSALIALNQGRMQKQAQEASGQEGMGLAMGDTVQPNKKRRERGGKGTTLNQLLESQREASGQLEEIHGGEGEIEEREVGNRFQVQQQPAQAQGSSVTRDPRKRNRQSTENAAAESSNGGGVGGRNENLDKGGGQEGNKRNRVA